MYHLNAKPDVYETIADLIEENHPELHAAGVTVLCQMHHSKGGLKLRGRPCYAIAKIVGPKDRGAGLPDARITVDAGKWEGLEDDRRRAILDHELQHFEAVGKWTTTKEPLPDRPDAFVESRTFDWKPDEAGRPKITMRPHDYEVGWFRVIAERHGAAAVECEQVAHLVGPDGQLLFPWSPEADSGMTDSERAAAKAMREEKARDRRRRRAVATPAEQPPSIRMAR